WHNAQPVVRGDVGEVGFALGHNGNVTNTAELAREAGMLPGVVSSDSDLIAELVATAHQSRGGDVVDALAGVLPRLEGAFSLVVMDHARLIGIRDPNGF